MRRLRDGYRGRLRSGADQKLAVNPGSQDRVACGAAESAGEPGQVPAAQGHGDGALHCRDQPVHEQPGGEDADQEGYDAGPVDAGEPLGAHAVEQPCGVAGPALLDPEVVHQHHTAPGCHPCDESDEPGVQHGGEVLLEDEEDDGGQREHADEQVELAAADGDVEGLRRDGEGVDVQDVGGDGSVQDHQQHRKCEDSEVLDDEFSGIDLAAVGGEAGAQDSEPDDGDELPQDRGQVDLSLGHFGADEAGVVGGVGEPGDPPADADGRHDGAHRGDPLRAFEDVAGRSGVGPVDLHAEPGDGGHHREDDDGGRHGPLFKCRDGLVAEPGDGHLRGHDGRGDADLPAVVLGRRVNPAEGSEERHHQVQDDPGVHRAPADHQQRLDGGGEVVSAPAERRAGQHHAGGAGLLAEQDEAAEQEHADQVPQNQNDNRVREAEAEVDAQGAEHPVDGRKVGARPDPELPGDLPGPLGFRDGLKPGFDVFAGYLHWAGRDCSGVVVACGASIGRKGGYRKVMCCRPHSTRYDMYRKIDPLHDGA